MDQVQATIAHRGFTLRRADVEKMLREVLPEPVGEHFAVVQGRRFPPKQVVGIATGLDRADYNTHQARQILRRLGFVVGRREHPERARSERRRPQGRTEADVLRPFVGQWVAQRGGEIIVAASTPDAVLEWLELHNQQADVMFRVPADAAEMTGAAPG
jgi:hypothetical protein